MSTDYLTPIARWLTSGAGRILSSLWGQAGINLTLAVAATIGLAGGLPAVAPHLNFPHFPIPIPTPPPTPAAIGLSGVIIVYESGWNMSNGQTEAILSSTTRAYLDTAVPAGADGRPSWRIWDKDVDRSNEDQIWQVAFNKAIVACAGKVPQVIAFDKAGNATAFPVPESPEALIDLLQKFQGK